MKKTMCRLSEGVQLHSRHASSPRHLQLHLRWLQLLECRTSEHLVQQQELRHSLEPSILCDSLLQRWDSLPFFGLPVTFVEPGLSPTRYHRYRGITARLTRWEN